MSNKQDYENRLNITLSRIPFPHKTWFDGYEYLESEQKFILYVKDENDTDLFADTFAKLSALQFNEEVIIALSSQKGAI